MKKIEHPNFKSPFYLPIYFDEDFQNFKSKISKQIAIETLKMQADDTNTFRYQKNRNEKFISKIIKSSLIGTC